MYEVRIYNKGRFEVYNGGRDKIVFTAVDPRLCTKSGDTYKFDDVRDMMREMVGYVSLATLKKMTKQLCAW